MRPQPWHIIVLVIALIVLFGWKSLPNMARSLGQSMRIFKSEVDQMKEPSAASQDTVRGERADGEGSNLRDRARDTASDLGGKARDTAAGVKDHGSSVRDEFRDGLRGDEQSADDVHRDDVHRDDDRA